MKTTVRRHFARICEDRQSLRNFRQSEGTRQLRPQTAQRKIYSLINGDSVFTSDNAHARRWRQMAYERRYNEIIDRMIADERRETLALQKVIFPTVALFLSTCFVGDFQADVLDKLAIIGKIILSRFVVVGV